MTAADAQQQRADSGAIPMPGDGPWTPPNAAEVEANDAMAAKLAAVKEQAIEAGRDPDAAKYLKEEEVASVAAMERRDMRFREAGSSLDLLEDKGPAAPRRAVGNAAVAVLSALLLHGWLLCVWP